MISRDFCTAPQEAITPRILIGIRKTGYLDLSTGSGDCVRDISGRIRLGFLCRLCRTNAGHRCRTPFRANSRPPKPYFILRDGTVTFSGNVIESWRRCRVKIVTRRIFEENSHFRSAGHFPKLSRFRTEIMSRNVLQQHFVL